MGPTRSAGRVGEIRTSAEALSSDLRSSVRSIVAEIQKPSGHDRPCAAPLVADAELFRHRLQARFTTPCRPLRAREFENIPERCEFNHDPHRSHRIDYRYPGRRQGH